MMLMSYGGTTSTICHGGGRAHPAISDLVVAVEYVDAGGNVQVVDDPEELKVAAGAFGLLGVLLSVTFRMDEMTHASYQPVVVDQTMEEYIPRPGTPLPDTTVHLFEVLRTRKPCFIRH